MIVTQHFRFYLREPHPHQVDILRQFSKISRRVWNFLVSRHGKYSLEHILATNLFFRKCPKDILEEFFVDYHKAEKPARFKKRNEALSFRLTKNFKIDTRNKLILLPHVGQLSSFNRHELPGKLKSVEIFVPLECGTWEAVVATSEVIL